MLKVMQVALILCCQQASGVHTFAFPPQQYPPVPAFISPSGKSVSVPAMRLGEPAKKQQKKKKQQNIAVSQIIKALATC